MAAERSLMTLEEQFTRLIQILQLIDSEPWKWDAADLEAKFSVSRATIERDIAILRQWGQIKRKNGKFGLAEMKFLPTSFTPPEALALRIAGSTFAEQAGAGYRDALATALKKIDQVLPQRISAEIRRAHARVAVSQPVVREFSASVYQDLQNAMIHHNPVDITYFSRSRSEPSKRRVDPYGLTFKIGAWYMVGFCHLRQGIRTFGLDRIKWLRVEDKLHFRYPADFDLQEWLAKGWQLQAGGEPTEVVVRFAPSTASWILGGQWHPTQHIDKQSDGSVLFRVIVSGYEEILYWVLSFGGQAEVLEPAPLRVAVADAARKMVGIYDAQN
ncbi:MAG: putative transcriptional regulator [Capsulimonas sp.]|jgi:predicted DNA-binding transcriptional regulator YafY|nr:putative transcriptional regulator [Capsulimonas sp.]